MTLRIGTLTNGGPFSLPPEIATKTIAVVGQKRSGKSHTVGVMEEECVKAHIPFIVLDPIGVHHGLRSTTAGKPWKPAAAIVLFGGRQGDIELRRDMGKGIAEWVVEENASCIIDLSMMSSKAAKAELVRDLCERLLQINTTPRHVFIEEAQLLIPQTVRPDWYAASDAVGQLVLTGGNFGLGVTLITQRPATVNKDALTQIEILVGLRMVGAQDRKAMLDMFGSQLGADQQGELDEFKRTIAGLPSGTAWVWWPLQGEFRQVRVRARETYHAGSTPTFDAVKVVQARPDVTALRQRFAAPSVTPLVEHLCPDCPKCGHWDDPITGNRDNKRYAAARKMGLKPTELAGTVERLQRELAEAQQLAVDWKSHHHGAMAELALMTASRDEEATRANAMRADAETLSQVRAAFGELGMSGGDGAGGGISRADVERIVADAVSRLPRGGETIYVTAPEVLRKKYQQEAVERVLTKVGTLTPEERRALEYLLGQDDWQNTTTVTRAMTGNSAGPNHKKWGGVLAHLVAIGIAERNSNRTATRAAVGAWVSFELAAHSPSVAEIDDVHRAVLARLAEGL